jgi:hypothetical protein
LPFRFLPEPSYSNRETPGNEGSSVITNTTREPTGKIRISNHHALMLASCNLRAVTARLGTMEAMTIKKYRKIKTMKIKPVRTPAVVAVLASEAERPTVPAVPAITVTSAIRKKTSATKK